MKNLYIWCVYFIASRPSPSQFTPPFFYLFVDVRLLIVGVRDRRWNKLCDNWEPLQLTRPHAESNWRDTTSNGWDGCALASSCDISWYDYLFVMERLNSNQLGYFWVCSLSIPSLTPCHINNSKLVKVISIRRNGIINCLGVVSLCAREK